MSFQDIFEISQSISVSNHRTVGQQISRSGEIRVAEYLTTVPWVFTVKPHNFLYYPQARQILNNLEVADRELVQSVNFTSNNLKWFTAYQGQLIGEDFDNLELASVPPANSVTFTMGGLPTVAPGTTIFVAGDFVTVGSYPYKVTQTVFRGSASTITVTVNRPIIYTPALEINSRILVANNVNFSLIMETFPTYTLVPMTNGAFIQWDSDFVFREAIGQI